MIDTGQNDSSLLNPHFVEDSKYSLLALLPFNIISPSKMQQKSRTFGNNCINLMDALKYKHCFQSFLEDYLWLRLTSVEWKKES